LVQATGAVSAAAPSIRVTTAVERDTFGVEFAVGLFLIAFLGIVLATPRRIFASIGYPTWVTASSVVTLLAGVGLLQASIHSTYSEENRAPELRIAIASAAFAVALPTAFAAIQRLRGKPGRVGLAAGLMLTVTATLLLMLLAVVEVASSKT
jgi:hypothetical protein